MMMLDAERDWQELKVLLDRIERRGPRSMEPAELSRLGALYRQTATQLSQIRDDPRHRRLAARLNGLVVRAHGQIYRPEKSSWGRTMLEHYARGFPAMLVESLPLQAAAAFLLFLGALLGYWAVVADPDNYFAIVPQVEGRSPGATVELLQKSLLSGRDDGTTTAQLGVFASFLFTNNMRVGILAFVAGVFAGVPTVVLLLYNGMMLGAMSAVFVQAGIGVAWIAWILPHGVTELGAIVICGGAGLLLGRSVLSPGAFVRSFAVQRGARRAMALALGTVPMFVLAAVIEGFFRQSDASTAQRLGLACATALLWLVYFAQGAKRQRPQ